MYKELFTFVLKFIARYVTHKCEKIFNIIPFDAKRYNVVLILVTLYIQISSDSKFVRSKFELQKNVFFFKADKI